MKQITIRKIRRTALWIVLTPLILFLLLAVLLYLPPVQRFAVDKITEALTEGTGMKARVGYVRLAFPIDLTVDDVTLTDRSDTLVAARSLRLDVSMLPLFAGRADINGFSLDGVRLNTKGLIADTYVRGTVGHLEAESHGVEWTRGIVNLDNARLTDADLSIALSDTVAEKDTTESMPWVINAQRIQIARTRLRLSLPGDSMRVAMHIRQGEISEGIFDTGRPYYAMRSIHLDGSGMTYCTRTVGTIAKRPNTAWQNGVVSMLWGEKRPKKGIDPSFIDLDNIALRIDSVSYNQHGTLRASLRKLAATERSGLALTQMSGSIYMDSTQLALPDMTLRTPHSQLEAALDLNFHALEAEATSGLAMTLDGSIAPEDIRIAAQGLAGDELIAALPDRKLQIHAETRGGMDLLLVRDVRLELPGWLAITGEADGKHLMADNRSIEARFQLDAGNTHFIQNFMPAESRGAFAIPRGTKLKGMASMEGTRFNADIRISASGGTLSAKAMLDTRSEAYRLNLNAKAFPLGRFVPESGMGTFSGKMTASGRGLNPMAKSARLKARAEISSLFIDRLQLYGLSLDAQTGEGQAVANITSNNDLIAGSGRIEAKMGRRIEARLTAAMSEISLYRMLDSKDSISLGTDIEVKLEASSNFSDYHVDGGIRHIRFLTPKKSMFAKDLLFNLTSSRDTTTAAISSGDLTIAAGVGGPLERLGTGFDRLNRELSRQMEEKRVDAEALRAACPTLRLKLEAGQDNPLSKILRYKGITFSSASIDLDTDPTDGFDGRFLCGALKSGNMLLDTIDVVLYQDTAGIKMDGKVRNFTKRNPNKFEVSLSAYLQERGIGAGVVFLNEAGRKGIDIGLRADLEDGAVNLALFPGQPIIAYRTFTVNKDNYIRLGSDRTLRANVDLQADDGTGLRIYGEPADSTNDLTVSVNHLNLDELSAVMPYLPRMAGMFSGDIHMVSSPDNLSIAAMASAEDFALDGTHIGSLGLEAIYLPKAGGEHHANAYVSYEGEEVMECEGTYFDSEGGTFEGKARLHRFPLRMVNGFLSGTDVALDGRANGEIAVNGALDRPVMNGTLSLDSARLYSDVYGFNLHMDEQPIRMEENRILFKDFALHSHTGGNPLVMNGMVDMGAADGLALDLAMKARNFELINARRTAASMVFGKVFADYDGTLRGTASNLSIRGKLNILERTDMTYILKDSPLTVEDRLNDLVQFIDFSDSTAVTAKAPAAEGSFDMTLGISVSDAARFHCNLSEDGQNYVDLEGGGDLTLRMTPEGAMRVTGRFTAGSGEMKYSLPIIPLKTFSITPGSYVDFTGNPLNPTLNITAKERVRATVTENEQPRSVTFDVGVAITKPLDNMGLEFIIEAPEDLGMQNQLASMTSAQRGKAAVAMLATGMYMTDDMLTSGGSGFKAGNALNAFLQSEIQNIAGSALRTIDLSIGMESGTSETGAETTDYSFRFAKRFWNNRISVIIGGRVSTGQNATNSAESIIDNVTVEYRLDKSASRYVKLFYDRSSQDPLEGQLTKTGAGIILRRKSNSLGDLFIFRSSKKDKK